MTAQTHTALVAGQFGPQAEAYVTSPVHARGADLDQLAEAARGWPAGLKALDLGCGGGHVSFTLAPHVTQIVAYDLSLEMLAAVAGAAVDRGLKNILTRQGRAEALPFPDGSFDVVASRYSAHHWHDFPMALREARRVVKARGKAIFIDAMAPASPLVDTHFQAIELLRDPSHVRDYSEAEWRRALKGAGFSPGAPTLRRLRLDFATWVARMRTPEPEIQAIRALQQRMPKEVADYLELEADGSFTIDTMVIEALAG
jgi:SAM-dependent methyltransferase